VVLGTPTFIAPEQILGDKQKVGPRSDLYSLGVLLYNMLCGSLPFDTEGVGVMLFMHLKDEPQPLRERVPDLPEEVARVVHRCLEKDPLQRPASALEVVDAYEAALNVAAPATLLAPGHSAAPQRSGHDNVVDPDTVIEPEHPADPRLETTMPRFPRDLHDAPTQINAPAIDDPVPPEKPARRPRSSRRARTRLVIGTAILITLLIAVALALFISTY
jgi:serine/threonine protein kinase